MCCGQSNENSREEWNRNGNLAGFAGAVKPPLGGTGALRRQISPYGRLAHYGKVPPGGNKV
jgi:hypothetical protein